MAHRIEGDMIVTGTITASGGFSGSYQRTSSALEAGTHVEIPLGEWKIWDSAIGAPITTPGLSADDLGIKAGTFGTNGIAVSTSDSTGASLTQYARTQVTLPMNYVSGQNVSVAFRAGMLTTVASVSATIDVAAYNITPNTESNSDLVTTSATSINSLTFAEVSFVVTPTGLVPNSILDIRVVITTNTATVAATFGAFVNSYLVLTTRG